MTADARADETLLESALGIPFQGGAAIDVYRNGDEIFPAMLSAIADARRRIEFLTFIYWTGDIADRFVDALCERARAGVEVLVVLDGFGARPMEARHVTAMLDAGVALRWFRPLRLTARLWRADHRTHRKILIVDGAVGFTGGVGIAEEWDGDASDPDSWRDTHFRLRGPVLNGLRSAFFEDWMEATGAIAPLFEVPTQAAPAGDLRAQAVPSAASVGHNPAARLHHALIAMARTRLRIASPYFAPDEATAELLTDAVRRGVEVEAMVPGPVIDKRVSELASSHMWSDLLDRGVVIMRYQPTLLHVKLITVDGRIATIGSANFNARSRRKDQELAVNVADQGFAALLDAQYDEDRALCEPLCPRRWRRRPVLRRALETLSRPLRGQT